MKIVYDALSQHGKFAQKCPIEKDTRYYFDNFRVEPEMLPSFIPLRESYGILTIICYEVFQLLFLPKIDN